jgi:hypothetical protein
MPNVGHVPDQRQVTAHHHDRSWDGYDVAKTKGPAHRVNLTYPPLPTCVAGRAETLHT